MEVVKRSSKLQVLANNIAVLHYLGRQKLLLWYDWLWSQFLVTVFLRALGVDAYSIHSGLPFVGRKVITNAFNTQPVGSYDAMVCSYRISAEGMNFHVNCSINIAIEQADSESKQEQAEYRVTRLRQQREQYLYRYSALNSIDMSIAFKNMRKANAHSGAVIPPEVLDRMAEEVNELQQSDIQPNATGCVDWSKPLLGPQEIAVRDVQATKAGFGGRLGRKRGRSP